MIGLPEIDIRRAVAADAPAVADLARRTFRDTFAEQNTAADMDSYLHGSFSTGRIEREIADPKNLFLLAWVADETPPLGYAKLATSPAPGPVGGTKPIELARLYVDRVAMGRGVGAALMTACLAQAERLQRSTIWLGVWEHNSRAIAFYARLGFVRVGSQSFRLGSDHQTDLVMARPVRP